MTGRIRLDVWLLEQGLVQSRAKAQEAIAAGAVQVDAKTITKPAQLISGTESITLNVDTRQWVSRAASKLLHGLEHFSLSPQGLIALDIGASTGGFTQVLLHHGACMVYAVDVGHGQIAQQIRQDAQVQVLEGVNARYLDSTIIQQAPHCITCDASFISLKLVLPAALALAASGAWLIALIKPQFEVGKELIGKGVVRDAGLHEKVCVDITGWLAQEQGWRVLGITPSPIDGQDGNKEFLIAAVKS